jgi:hypothetical protein
MEDSGNEDVARDDRPRKGKSKEQRGRVIQKEQAYSKHNDFQAKSSLSKKKSDVHKEENKINKEMVRQKHYHDRKSKWKKIDYDEEVNVHFPRRKHGISSKLSKFWQGPYLVVKTLSGLTYLVKCDKRGSYQIQVDGMGKECN